MGSIERLIKNYEDRIALTWEQNLSYAERILFAVYDPTDERRLRCRIGSFEIATKSAGHDWSLLDITDSFGVWMSSEKRRDAYFANPDVLFGIVERYESHLVESITAAIDRAATGSNDVFALLGAGSVFGLTHLSKVLPFVADAIPGRLLVFFPGHWDSGNYRLFAARDGFNYLAVPVTA